MTCKDEFQACIRKRLRQLARELSETAGLSSKGAAAMRKRIREIEKETATIRAANDRKCR